MKDRFAAEVVSVDDWSQALARLADESFDLMLVNRKLDRDYSDGLDVIRHLKSDPDHAGLPVMMITNYPEHQRLAIDAGAEPGFGKLELAKSETVDKLRPFLDGDHPTTS